VEALSVLELDVLKLALSQSPIVVTAVTMIDRVVDPGPVVAEARARIATVAGVNPADLVIVPVSSFRKRDAIEEQSLELLADSGFPALEAEIWGGLAVTCGAAQVHAALDAMSDALAEAAAPIANELAGLSGDLAEIDKELRDEQETQRGLKADARGWRRSLQADLDHVAYSIQRRLDSDWSRSGTTSSGRWSQMRRSPTRTPSSSGSLTTWLTLRTGPVATWKYRWNS